MNRWTYFATHIEDSGKVPKEKEYRVEVGLPRDRQLAADTHCTRAHTLLHAETGLDMLAR